MTPLGEMAQFEMGQAPPGTECNVDGIGTLFVKAGEFGQLYPIEREWTTKPLKRGRRGDIFICVVGATAGKLNLGIDCAIGRSVAAIRPSPALDTRFLYYQLQPWVQKLRAASAGSAQGVISKKQLAAIPIEVPPLVEQRRVVCELEKQFSRLDRAVADLQRVNANVRLYKAAVRKAATEGLLVPTEAELSRRESRDYEPASKLLERVLEYRQSQSASRERYKTPVPVNDRRPFEVPEGWTWATLDQLNIKIADVDHKMPKAYEGGIPYVSTKDFTDDDGINFVGAKHIAPSDYISLSRKIAPERGDILLSRYGTVGEVRVVSVGFPFQASYSVAILKPVRGLTPVGYLAAVLRSEVVQVQIKRDVRATAQPDLGLAHIRQFVVPLPPLAEQDRIVAEIDRRMSLCREIEAEVDAGLKRASNLRRAVLRRAFAFSGEIVSSGLGQAPKGEPATLG